MSKPAPKVCELWRTRNGEAVLVITRPDGLSPYYPITGRVVSGRTVYGTNPMHYTEGGLFLVGKTNRWDLVERCNPSDVALRPTNTPQHPNRIARRALDLG